MLLMQVEDAVLPKDAASMLTAMKMIAKGAERARCKPGSDDNQSKAGNATQDAFCMQAVCAP